MDQSYPITEAAAIISDKFFNTDATLGGFARRLAMYPESLRSFS
jgi:hypothetical protein